MSDRQPVAAGAGRRLSDRLVAVLMRREVQLLLAITTGGAVIRFATLDDQSLWFDETVTAGLIAMPLDEMLEALPSSESAPPLYYVLAWMWARIFGSSDAVLRSFSAFAGTLTIPVAYGAARVLVTRRAAVVVGLLAMCSPVLVWYSQEARAYGLLVLLSAGSLLAFGLLWRAREPEPRLVALWVVLSCLALLTYYYAVFLLLAEAILLAARHGRTRRIVLGTAAIVLLGIALLPLAAVQGRAGIGWIHEIPRSERTEETIRQVLTPATAPRWAGTSGTAPRTRQLWLVAALLPATALALALFVGQGREREGALIGIGLGTATILVPLVLSLIGPLIVNGADTFLYRALLPAWLPLAIAVGAGFGARGAGRLGLACAGVLVSASIAVTIAIGVDRDLQRSDWRSLASATRGGELLVVAPAFEGQTLQHYRSDLEPVTAGRLSVAEVDVLVRSPDLELRLPPSFELVGERRIQHWTVRQFRSVEPVEVDTGRIAGSSAATGHSILRTKGLRSGAVVE